MNRAGQAAVLAVFGAVAFSVGARNGALGALKVLEAQARRTAAQRAAVAAALAAEDE